MALHNSYDNASDSQKNVDAEVVSKRDRYDEDDQKYAYYVTVSIPDSDSEAEIPVSRYKYEDTDVGDTIGMEMYTSVFGIHILVD